MSYNSKYFGCKYFSLTTGKCQIKKCKPEELAFFTGFPDYWFAPGTRPHLHVPGVTKGGEVCLRLILWVTPLNEGELKV